MHDYQGKTHIDWKDIDQSIEGILKELPMERFDTILGLARGGMIPATILAYKTKCHNLQQLGVRTRDVDNIQYYGAPQLAGNVLIVDDINDSGLTFSSVKDYIKHHFDHDEIKTITYASLIKRSSTSFNEDITGLVADNDSWYVFPWD